MIKGGFKLRGLHSQAVIKRGATILKANEAKVKPADETIIKNSTDSENDMLTVSLGMDNLDWMLDSSR